MRDGGGTDGGGTDGSSVVTLRAMDASDLDLVRRWMAEPHVVCWYLADSSIDEELDELRACVAGEVPTHALLVTEDGRPVGWCQWYRCDDYPEHAAGVGAAPGDLGIDYAVGDPDRIGRGVGTAMVAALVAHVTALHPTRGIVADPDARHAASRRVLEKAGFHLVAERPVPSERSARPMAVYRRPAG